MRYNKILLHALSLFIILGVTFVSAQQTTWVEKNGLLIIETESTRSPLGKWKKKTDNPNYTGSGHLEFTGNGINGGNADSPLTYKFKINKAGDYSLFIRARKRLEGAEPDKCNDGWVKMAGDFDAVSDGAPKDWLTGNTKMFGGPETGWGWALKLDKHEEKKLPKYKFKQGEVYTFTLSGRSIRWNTDRLVFAHSSIGDAEAKKTSHLESDTLGSTPIVNNQSATKNINSQSHISYINGSLKLNNMLAGTYPVRIALLNGKIVLAKTIHVSTGTFHLDLSSLTNGVYIAGIKGNGVSEEKVITVNK